MTTNKIDDNERALLTKDFEVLYKETPLTKETQCGYWPFKKKFMQLFANKYSFIAVYGLVGCCMAGTNSYYNSTISTIEKRFHISSRNSAVISLGYEFGSLIMMPFMNIFSHRHRPRWMGFGALTIATYVLLLVMLHVVYGPGEDARALTKEYREASMNEISALDETTKLMCRINVTDNTCSDHEGNLLPQLYIFSAQIPAGMFGPLYECLGLPYIDDNVLNVKTPLLLSIKSIVNMLGSPLASFLASFSLGTYIIPNATPVINPKDPRWLGAWWLGWLVIGICLLVFAFLVSLFPRKLPRAALRQKIEIARKKFYEIQDSSDLDHKEPFRVYFKRIVTNKAFMVNAISYVFYCLGTQPYWMFTQKYIETQYRQSAAESSRIRGNVTLVTSIIGLLGSGFVISKFRPSARALALWNIIVSIIFILCIFSYTMLGCQANDHSTIINPPLINNSSSSCMSECNCEYVKYTPICGNDGSTYISPCHAGCTDYFTENGTKFFTNCKCISTIDERNYDAKSGPCSVDCSNQLSWFIVALSISNFIQSTGRTSNSLIGLRAVLPKDRSFSIALSVMMNTVFAFIPGPFIFGWIFDQTCLLWGKTCTIKGNCWIYDGAAMRYYMNMTAASIFGIGLVLDIGTWYFVKNLVIFKDNDNVNMMNLLDVQ